MLELKPMLIRRIVVGPLETNCYIVADSSRKGVIIDPGADDQLILDEASQFDIKMILLTHGHADHISALKKVKEVTRAPFAIHSLDVSLLGPNGLNYVINPNFSPLPPPDKLLVDNDEINIGELIIKALHTPGHSPGSLCFLINNVLFSGDILFYLGIGRTDLGGDFSMLISSIKDKLMILADDIKVYPGHGPTTTVGTERRGNPFLSSII